MNCLSRSLAVALALVAGIPAVATETTVEAVATPAATAPAPVAAAAEAPRPSATPAAQATENKNEPPKVPPGYKVKVIDGETRYCRKSVPVGTRFPTEVCMTQAQYEDQERNRDSMRNAIQDRQKSYSINN